VLVKASRDQAFVLHDWYSTPKASCEFFCSFYHFITHVDYAILVAGVSPMSRLCHSQCVPPYNRINGPVIMYFADVLLFDEQQGDRNLSEISHIIVDEVHERTVLVHFRTRHKVALYDMNALSCNSTCM
jgi:hypothetical protein